MLRPVLVAGGTIAGLIALFTYKTHVPGTALVAAPSSPVAHASAGPARPAAVSASALPSKTATHKASPSPTRTTPTATPTTPAPVQTTTKATPTATPPPTPTKTAPSGTFTGNPVNTQYGEVQVQITVQNGKITSANGGLPQGGDSIAANAIPVLNNEVIQAQSANVQSVSGATYTSQGYIGSLQQAINEAGL
jgi:uncharacterized protein with FMN-binding domain